MFGLDRLALMFTLAIAGYLAEDNSSNYQGRTILGRGKSCRVGSEHGTCMFQWQCRNQGGTSMSPCLNGILFGTCCKIPDGKQDNSPSSNLMVSDHTKPTSSHQPSSSKLPQRIYSVQTTSEMMNRPTTAFRTTTVRGVVETEGPIPKSTTTERTTLASSDWWKETTSLPLSTSTFSALDRTSDRFSFSSETEFDMSTKRTTPALSLHSSVLTTLVESLSGSPQSDLSWNHDASTMPSVMEHGVADVGSDGVHANTIEAESVTQVPSFPMPPHMNVPSFPVNIPSFGEFHTNPPGEADDFPLGAIQQIISDFANESSPFPWFVNSGVTTPPPQLAWNTQNFANTNTREGIVTESTTPSMSSLIQKNPTVLFPPTPGPLDITTSTHPFMSGVVAIGLSDSASIDNNIPPKPPPIIGIQVVNSTSSSVLLDEVHHEVAADDHESQSSTHSSTTEVTVSSSTVRVPLPWTTSFPEFPASVTPPVIHRTTPPSTTVKVTMVVTNQPILSTLQPFQPTRRPITRRPTRRTTTSRPPATTKRTWNYKKDCGVRPLAPRGRIVGGKKAFFGQWPWQALVKEATWFGLVVKTKCGGVLINNKYVLTAAHCQPGWLASLLVLLGEYDLTSENEQYKPLQRNVRRVVTHRDFNPATFENDLALLELDKTIDFQPHIVPICLPTAQDQSGLIGRAATVSGWGRLTTGGSLPSVLHYVQVPLLANNICQDMFLKAGQVKNIRNSFVCAGYADGGKDSCEGDSGGPLTLQRNDSRWELIGIVSHGIKCAYPNLPGVYTRIASFLDWIGRIV